MFSKYLPSLTTLLLGLLTISSISCRHNKFHKSEGLIWNTSYHITYAGDPSLADSVITVLNDVGKSLNVFDSTSLVSRVNHADTTIIDSHFRNVYNASLAAYKVSEGMFDPTLSPLIAVWGFGPGHKMSADTANIAQIMEYVGLEKTRLKGDTLIKDNSEITFNFSAVAKGYACDAVASMLRRNKVTNYLVEIGGEIAMGGMSPSGDLWKVSVDRPIEKRDSIIHDASAILKITDSGMATSGNYRNFHTNGGINMGHTISPKTGRPVVTDVLSATIIAPTAMEADAIATACMAAGSDKAKQMMDTLSCECLLILSDSTIWTTPGLSRFLVR